LSLFHGYYGQYQYDDYIQRGESEHRMDELKNGLCAGRLSCHRFMSNFFQLILHTVADGIADAGHPLLRRFGADIGSARLWRMTLSKRVSQEVKRFLRPAMSAFSVIQALWLPHYPFRGLPRVHSRYGLPARQITKCDPFIKDSDGFVASTAASIATGRNDQLPGGYNSR
jgi:hypothetical protein